MDKIQLQKFQLPCSFWAIKKYIKREKVSHYIIFCNHKCNPVCFFVSRQKKHDLFFLFRFFILFQTVCESTLRVRLINSKSSIYYACHHHHQHHPYTLNGQRANYRHLQMLVLIKFSCSRENINRIMDIINNTTI